MAYVEEKTFNKVDFTSKALEKGEYDNCTFKECDFSNSDLSDVKFLECKFDNCNLSMTKLINTSLCDVRFKNCKMLGMHFENCNEFGFSIHLEDCNLSLSSFYKIKMKKNTFKNLKFHECDFTESDLSLSVFDQCDFAKATFDNTNLEKADLQTSFNYSIDPEKNRIKKAKFSLNGITDYLINMTLR